MTADFFIAESEITDIETGDMSIPDKFSVSQNYPNPFNPFTTITFTLPEKSFVTLEIFDSLGGEVSKLIAKEMLPGTYSREWNAEGLPSGAYFYRLQAGLYTETEKLVLLRQRKHFYENRFYID